ncbi:MAG TPA: pyridoxal phosphate-dependent aminotransferase [Clostridiaceae bacterium]|nr:pyridoxal phosphate-dependent aminotransferase [Clostridiaceae bacterium]
MRTFQKSSKLFNVAYDVRGPALDEAMRMENEGIEILKLNIGNPGPFGFQAPQAVLDSVAEGLRKAQGYSDSKGLYEDREAIANYHLKMGIEGVTAEDVYTGNGVSELIQICMQGLLDDGDEILIPAPDYPLWTAMATLAGGTVRHYICDEKSNWQPDIADMRAKINDKTKAIVVINPNNPTGVVYSEEILKQIVELAREHELIIFSDEIYDRLVMDDIKFTSIASLAPDLFCITLNGLSKSHLIAGFRIGWMCLSGPKIAVRSYIEGLNMLSSMRLCSNVPAQLAISAALAYEEETKMMISPGGRVYEQREAVCNALDRVEGLSYVRPQAAFYVFPKLDIERFGITSDERFVFDFLREQHVLLVRGGGFHWPEPDHFRIVFLPETQVLEEAVGRLARFLKSYRQDHTDQHLIYKHQ